MNAARAIAIAAIASLGAASACAQQPTPPRDTKRPAPVDPVRRRRRELGLQDDR